MVNGEPECVFRGRKGEPLYRTTFAFALKQILKKAGMREIRVHDLRHTYATERLLRGDNIGDVSYQLGHSSIKLTYDTYTHWIPGKFKRQTDDLFAVQPPAIQMQPAKITLLKFKLK